MDRASKKRFDRHRIYIILSFLLGIIALIYAISDIYGISLVFSLEKMSTLLGVIISLLGLFVTAYFVILATDAYAHIKDIENAKNEALQTKSKIEEDLHNITLSKEEIEKDAKAINLQIQKTEETIKIYSGMLYEDLGERIALEGRGTTATTDKNKIRRRNALKLRQARLCYIFPMLDTDIREKLLLQLGDIGEEQDIFPIERIAEDENGNEHLKEIAKTVLAALREKLNTEKSSPQHQAETTVQQKEENIALDKEPLQKRGCMPVFLGMAALIGVIIFIFL